MPLTLDTAAGPVLMKECWEGYEKGMDLSRGPVIRQVYFLEDTSLVNPVLNALMGVGFGVPPARCPEANNLVAIDANMIGMAELYAAGQAVAVAPQFHWALIAVTFGIRPWPSFPDQDQAQSFDLGPNPESFVFMEQSIDWDTEVLKIADTTYQFKSTGKPVDVPIAYPLATCEFNLVRKFQLSLPTGRVTGYLNRLNKTKFLGQDIGTVRFCKPRTRRSYCTDGTATSDFSMTFKWREQDHNKQLLPDGSDFDFIQTAGGKYPFQYAELNDLLS